MNDGPIFSALEAKTMTLTQTASGCSPAWQVGDIPAETTQFKWTATGSTDNGQWTFTNHVLLFSSLTTNTTQTIVLSRDLYVYHDGATQLGKFRTGVQFDNAHSFSATIEALDASNNVIGTVSGSFSKPDCESD